ncbi:TlpA family protein disulfide reductase [Nesterenkonia populi]|uniref:TlpA family protein disulfide reductase n=1 Tax=Nesterenkonia populi TaxID=1591087 RepID=UPI0011BDF717|nr:TlpA disulfide reductase family protein [Nesterenkonia populi]
MLRRRSPRASRALTAVALCSALALAACGSEGDDLADRAGNDGTNYVAGDGTVEEYAPESRGESLAFEAETFDGDQVSEDTFQDEVSVVNFWYANCPPCRKEAPDLQEIHEDYADDGVQFLGVNTRDTQPTAEAFERNFGITYPSIEDRGGSVMLAVTDYVPPSAVPTTLVIDREGRVSARIIGLVDPGTLRALIDTALDEE